MVSSRADLQSAAGYQPALRRHDIFVVCDVGKSFLNGRLCRFDKLRRWRPNRPANALLRTRHKLLIPRGQLAASSLALVGRRPMSAPLTVAVLIGVPDAWHDIGTTGPFTALAKHGNVQAISRLG